jgi:hypothetical protein
MPRKVFTPGEVLAAADVNEFLMDQTIMTFAGTAARGSAIGTATEGMYAHLNDTDTLTYYNGSDWVNRIGASAGILQVVSTAKTDTFTSTSTSYTPITGLTASITPSSATSKVLVMVQLSFALGGSGGGVNYGSFRLTGGNAGTYIGDSPSSRQAAVFGGTSDVNNVSVMLSGSIVFLDSPNTTSSTTYGVETITRASGFIAINRANTDTDNTFLTRGASSITVMEVSA